MPSLPKTAIDNATQSVSGTVRGPFKGSAFAITYPIHSPDVDDVGRVLSDILSQDLSALDKLAFQQDSRLEFGPETGAGVLEITFYLPGWDVTE